MNRDFLAPCKQGTVFQNLVSSCLSPFPSWPASDESCTVDVDIHFTSKKRWLSRTGNNLLQGKKRDSWVSVHSTKIAHSLLLRQKQDFHPGTPLQRSYCASKPTTRQTVKTSNEKTQQAKYGLCRTLYRGLCTQTFHSGIYALESPLHTVYLYRILNLVERLHRFSAITTSNVVATTAIKVFRKIPLSFHTSLGIHLSYSLDELHYHQKCFSAKPIVKLTSLKDNRNLINERYSGGLLLLLAFCILWRGYKYLFLTEQLHNYLKAEVLMGR